MDLVQIYNSGHGHSHEAGLQAVWDAAQEAARAELAAVPAEEAQKEVQEKPVATTGAKKKK